jgi:hypothetical protein
MMDFDQAEFQGLLQGAGLFAANRQMSGTDVDAVLGTFRQRTDQHRLRDIGDTLFTDENGNLLVYGCVFHLGMYHDHHHHHHHQPAITPPPTITRLNDSPSA